MSEREPLNRIPFLYHFTDRRNLQLIRERRSTGLPRAERRCSHAPTYFYLVMQSI